MVCVDSCAGRWRLLGGAAAGQVVLHQSPPLQTGRAGPAHICDPVYTTPTLVLLLKQHGLPQNMYEADENEYFKLFVDKFA